MGIFHSQMAQIIAVVLKNDLYLNVLFEPELMRYWERNLRIFLLSLAGPKRIGPKPKTLLGISRIDKVKT